MNSLFEEKNLLLGITGSIAAYKGCDLASKLAQAGAAVEAILTPSAMEFVTPLAFQSVTGRRAYTEEDLWGPEGHVQHIGLARKADMLVIAPATANTIAKLAHGIADNLLTVTALATSCPLLIAPAMDGGMFQHPATQANLEALHEREAVIIGPAEGHLASGLFGTGRMVEPAELVGHIRLVLARGGPLSGQQVVITAGGTQELIDPVRYIANRSSGKQGFALAQAALDLGAKVILITAPTHLQTPIGAQRVDVTTAGEMRDAVLDELSQARGLIMAAAVADFRPTGSADQKLKRKQGIPEIKLENTPDILAEVSALKENGKFSGVLVGFAAESQNLLKNASEKLAANNLDLIAANDITAQDAGFAVDTNRITLLDRDGGLEELPLMTKTEVAEKVLARVVELLG